MKTSAVLALTLIGAGTITGCGAAGPDQDSDPLDESSGRASAPLTPLAVAGDLGGKLALGAAAPACSPPFTTPVYTQPADDGVALGSLLEGAGYGASSNSDWSHHAALADVQRVARLALANGVSVYLPPVARSRRRARRWGRSASEARRVGAT
jgi:hypothetical protein